METIMKIPFLLAMTASLITGLVSIMHNASTNQTCVRMIVALICFYLLGIIVSKTLTGIIEEQNRKKDEAEKLQKLEELRLMELERAEKLKQEDHLGTNLDLVADSSIDDGFSPLDLSQAIRTKVNE